MATQLITAEVIDGNTYYTAEARGVSYCAYQSTATGRWWVSSRRLSLGRFNPGGGKWYGSVAEVAAGCKAFAALDVLLATEGGAA